MKKKILSAILATVMTLSSLSVSTVLAFAVNAPDVYYINSMPGDGGIINEYITDKNGNIVTMEEISQSSHTGDANYVDSPIYKASNLPASYSSVDTGYITPVKDQGSWGTCWAHAYIAAAEASLVAQGYTDNTIDLSEAHLVWFRGNGYVENSDIPVQRDRFDSQFAGTKSLNGGGNNQHATATVAKKSGFALESDFPYDRMNYKAMQFDSSDMFNSKYELALSRHFLNTDKDEIKQHIMQYGAVTASIYSSVTYLSREFGSYYCPEQKTINHGITVVGWDDNYAVSNFNKQPPKKGAWFCKNSYGRSWGNKGYFWVSYADASLSNFWNVVAKPAENDFVYQYDGIACNTIYRFSGTAWAANVFTAEHADTISECSFIVGLNNQTTCTAYLYANLTSNDNPIKGTLIAQNSLTTNREGFYTLSLPNEYVLTPGEKFSIVIKYATNNGERIGIYCETTGDDDRITDVKSGQSFYTNMGTNYWFDFVGAGQGNVPIKAYVAKPEAEQYNINILNNTGVATINSSPVVTAAENDIVTISATVPEYKVFDKWTSVSGNVNFADANSAVTTFKMPANDVSIKATFNTHPHTYNWVVTKAPTCTASGVERGTCACGDVQSRAVPATGHTSVIDDAVEATCTTSGLTQGSHCSVCNATIIAQQTIPAHGHTEVIREAIAPTCTNTGLTEGRYCSVCKKDIVTQQIVPATGHTVVVDEAVAPTCTQTGLTQGSHCSECGKVIVAQTTIKATGHKEATVPATEATCTSNGLTEGKYCSVCHDTLVEQETIPMLEHSWNEEFESTLTHHWHTCSVCGAISEKETHTPGAPATETNPQTCTECGYLINPALESTLVKIKIVAFPHNTKLQYKSNASTEGLRVLAEYSDGTIKDVSNSITVSNFSSNNQAGSHNATVSFGDKTATFAYTVEYAWWQMVIRILLLGFLWY